MDLQKIAAGNTGIRTRVKAETVRPIHNRVIVSGMNFGEQKTAGGIIITSDDGKDRGIKPRWGQVFSKGLENDDPYDVGDWILVEHGRWTRGYDIENENGDVTTLRTVEAESVLMWSDEKPADLLFGDKEGAGAPDAPKAEDFGAR